MSLLHRKVTICGADFGPAPVTLPPPQVAQLLGPGAVLGLIRGSSSAASASDPAAMIAAATVSPEMAEQQQQQEEEELLDFQSGPDAGISWLADGSVLLSQNGNFTVLLAGGSSAPAAANQKKPGTGANTRNAFRQAQYLCAVIGTLMLNVLLWLDATNRIGNAKDFMINFASDIIAVGAVLIITDILIARDAAWDEVEASSSEGNGGGVISFAQQFAARLWNGTTARNVRRRIRTTMGGGSSTPTIPSAAAENQRLADSEGDR